MKRTIALLLTLLGLFWLAAPATAQTTQAMNHTCLSSTTINGLRVGACLDGYVNRFGNGFQFILQVEFICNGPRGTVRCRDVRALDQEYTSPWGWGGYHRYTCGLSGPAICGTGRNYDTGVSPIFVTSGMHHWVGKTWNITINNGGIVFTMSFFQASKYIRV